MKEPLISVIVPVYNAEKYIRQCAASLFGQTYSNMEYIFIDDCSTDSSIETLQATIREFSERKDQVKIIRHTNNAGVASARNTGLDNATGDYIGWCDADDWVEKDMYGGMLETALAEDSDIVICDNFYNLPDGRQTQPHPVKFGNKDETLINWMTYSMTTLWLTLAARKIFTEHNLHTIPKLDLLEDYGLTSKMLFYSGRTVHLQRPLYHYRLEVKDSITNSQSEENHISGLRNAIDLADFFIRNKAEFHVIKRSLQMVQERKGFLLYRNKDVKSYIETLPESNSYTLTNPRFGVKRKYIEACIILLYKIIDRLMLVRILAA